MNTTVGNGPEFQNGQQVIIVEGTFQGFVGLVEKYNPDTKTYLLNLWHGVQCIEPGTRLREVKDDPNVKPGSRVLIRFGDYAGQAGTVTAEIPLVRLGRALMVTLDDGQDIQISAYVVLLSPYQNEKLEDVPSV